MPVKNDARTAPPAVPRQAAPVNRVAPPEISGFVGLRNLRDLGGHATSDGKSQVKRGVLFRSDALGSMQPQDVPGLEKLRLRQVIDLRGPYERSGLPDPIESLRPRPLYLNIPVVDLQSDFNEKIGNALQARDTQALDALLGGGANVRVMVTANQNFVRKASGLFSTYLKTLADAGPVPALVHCSSGKDRTGFAAAITLLALGVPEAEVMKDYLVSNACLKKGTEETLQYVQTFWPRAELLRPVLGVDATFLQAALDTIKSDYGSFDHYLRAPNGLNLDEATLEKLRGAAARADARHGRTGPV